MKEFFPELDYILSKSNSDIFFYNPDDYIFGNTNSVILGTDNIFKLIFDSEYTSNTYMYKFNEVQDLNNLPPDILTRCSIIRNKIIYLSTDDIDGINYFNLNTEDLKLLDEFVKYRNDNSPNINSIVYSNLTNTGKHIYNLLYYFLTHERYIDISSLNSDNMLELLIRTYLVQLYLKALSKQMKEFYIKDEIIK